MSRILDELPVTGRSGPKFSYPWDEWTDGRVWEITRGEDFQVSTRAMYSMIGTHAASHGFTVTKRKRGDSIAFQFRRVGK